MILNRHVCRATAQRYLRIAAILVSPPATMMVLANSALAQTAAITLVSEEELSPRLRELTLSTPSLATQSGFLSMLGTNAKGTTKVRVLLPAGYDPAGSRRYPVLYLYHGGTENRTAWTSPELKGKAEEISRGLPLIIVMPDGGMAGGYSDWYNGGSFGAPRWKSYHLDELIPWIDAHYLTIANRSGRATAGLSMGGGGLRYAAQRPDLIGATASFSGDIDITQPESDWRGAGAMVSKLIWGDYAKEQVRWRGANGPDLAKNLSDTDVAIFTGDTGRPEGTYIRPGAQKLDGRLNHFGIAHQFTVYPGMTHSWPNWNRALTAWLPHLMTWFGEQRPGRSPMPASFTYSSIEGRYSIGGWTVAMDRNTIEFSALQVVEATRFSLSGSGDAKVSLPALPRTRFRVHIVQPGHVPHDLMISADDDGQLTIPVPLGPANPFQQYSKEADALSTGPATDDVPFELFNNGSRFYRTDVTVSVTAAGLCKAISAFTTDKGTRTSLCALLKDVEKKADPAFLRSFETAAHDRADRILTRAQVATLLQWAKTL